MTGHVTATMGSCLMQNVSGQCLLPRRCQPADASCAPLPLPHRGRPGGRAARSGDHHTRGRARCPAADRRSRSHSPWQSPATQQHGWKAGLGCSHTKLHLWFCFCSFCWLELLFFAFKTYVFMSQWLRVTLGSRCARLDWVIFHPLLNYISFNKHFHTFGHFLFINHYDLSLDTDQILI